MRALAVVVGLVLVSLAAAPAAGAAPAAPRELRVVLANVGNVNVPACSSQAYKLCQRAVENRAAQALAAVDADLIALIEVLPPELCERSPSSSPSNLCSGPLVPPSQVTRLLGPSIARTCDTRFGWDCLAVAPEALRLGRRFDTRPVLDPCEDAGFTVSVGTVRSGGWPVKVAVAHPSSTDEPCRTAQLRDLFGAGLPAGGPAIVLGDLNVDPYREEGEDVDVWDEYVPSRFQAASTDALTSFPFAPSQADPSGETLDNGVAIDGPPGFTRRTLDHVLVRDGVSGRCEVQRVDGGGGMDHRAQVCAVTLASEVAPRYRLRARGCRVTAKVAPAPPWLRGVRFTAGGKRRVDRRAPYRLHRPRGSTGRVIARPLLPGAAGPRRSIRLRGC